MVDLGNASTRLGELKGRRALITGGTTGIGRAVAIMLAREGARVFIGGRDQHFLDDALADIRAAGEGDGAVMDLSDADAPRRFSDLAAERLGGGYDICVLNAAVAAGGLTQTSEADLRYVIATDFTAYLLGAHAAVERMGGQGDLILVGSMAAHVRGPSSTIYAGIKSGIAGFAEALRRELGPKGVRVALIEPGKTGSNMQLPDISPEKQREMIAAEQMLEAEDIALGVRYLLTQPRRTVVQQLVIVPRALEE